MRLLISAIGYAEATNRKLSICWPIIDDPTANFFQAQFSDLWSNNFRIVTVEKWFSMLNDPGVLQSDVPPDLKASARLVAIDSISEFYSILPKPPSEYAAKLTPTTLIQHRIDQIHNRFQPGRLIGLHIRTHHAHEKTREHSPVEWYEAQIKRLKLDYPQANFFLCSDDAKTSLRLHQRFPNTLIEQETPPGYNTKEGIQKAVADLYTLAKCDHIVGSYWSSFSTMARNLQKSTSYIDSMQTFGNGF